MGDTLLAGVGVEPVPEHVENLRPCLNRLPSVTLVQAAMGRQEQVAPVYALSQETYRRALEQVNPQEAGALSEQLLYLC